MVFDGMRWWACPSLGAFLARASAKQANYRHELLKPTLELFKGLLLGCSFPVWRRHN